MTNEQAFIVGFCNGLLYAQTYNDVEGGKQTLEAHLPEDWWDGTEWRTIEGLEEKITAIFQELNDECSVSAHRFKDGPWTNSRVIEVASSEGFHGLPDWE